MNRKSFAIILMFMVLPCALLFTACGDSSGNGGGSSSGDGQWNINFIVDEEVYATVKSSGKEYIKMPANPDKSGCAFIGWYFDKGTWQNQLKANTFQNTEITENVNVFAYFMTDSSNGVKVEVYIDDEKVQTLTTNEAKGYKIDVPDRPKDIITDPSISRYFLAWFIDRECTMKLNEDDTFKLNSKIYAKWIDVYYDEFLYTVEDGKATITKFLNKRCRTDVVIPSQIDSIPVEELGDGVLESQTRLKNIIICDGIKRLSDQFLPSEENLTNLRLPNTLERLDFSRNLSSISELNYNYYGNAFYVGNEINPYLFFVNVVDTSAESIAINIFCKFIGNFAFAGCKNLISIVIPNGVTTIGNCAFYYCDKLSIYCEATSQPSGWGSYWNYSGCNYCPVYWYSETQPTPEGNYWHYDTDGKTPLKW